MAPVVVSAMMEYEFNYKIKAKDLFVLALSSVYQSIPGVCNVIFTFSMLTLTIVKWSVCTDNQKLILLFVCCIFPVFQPAAIYLRSRRMAGVYKEPIQIGFNREGVHVKMNQQQSDLSWKMVKKAVKKCNGIILYSNANYGYLLTNRVLGRQREEIFNYLTANIEQSKK